MAYALSEDVVLPVGTALQEGRLDPFPYREDVSVGLYILELARRGSAACQKLPESEVYQSGRSSRRPGPDFHCAGLAKVRVVPHQRKDAMPLEPLAAILPLFCECSKRGCSFVVQLAESHRS